MMESHIDWFTDSPSPSGRLEGQKEEGSSKNPRICSGGLVDLCEANQKVELARHAWRLYLARVRRSRLLPRHLVGEPA